MMKKICIISLSLLATVACAPHVFASAVIETAPNSSLAAYWTFDGNKINWTTDQAFDSSDNNNTGAINYMSPSVNSVNGKIGQALLFNGYSTSIGLASNPLSSMANPSSACAWAETSDLTSHSAGWNQTILDLSSGGNDGVRMGSIVNSGVLYATYESGGVPYGVQSTASVFSNNQWVNVCYVWNGSVVALYANGVSLATAVNTDSVGSPSTIGARDDLGDGTWKGSLDDIRVYSRALSADEVKRIYQAGAAVIGKVPSGKAKIDVSQSPGTLASGLVGYWPFDGKTMNWTTNTAADISGNDNTGTLVGMSNSSSAVIGKIGQALKFDGVNSYVGVPNNSKISFDKTNPFSISAWVKVTSTTVPTGCGDAIVGKADNVTYTGYFLDIALPGTATCSGQSINGNSVFFTLYPSDGISLEVESPPNSIALGSWQHVAVTYDGSSHASGARIYINGILQTDTVIGDFLYLSTGSLVNTDGLEVGNDNTGDWMTGNLDDVRVYNRALSAAEVKQLYLMGK